jgi:Mg/Co/Ni transporter MgtE
MFKKYRRHKKLKYEFRTSAFVGLYCIIVLGIVFVLSRGVPYMISGTFNIKLMFSAVFS